MSQCTKCGTNFVGTPENPALPGLCRYCQIENLKAELTQANATIDSLMATNAGLTEQVRARRAIIETCSTRAMPSDGGK